MAHPQPPAPTNGQSPFDAIRHEDEQGEYWLARELQKELGYTASWQNFERAIEEAKAACQSQGYEVTGLFNGIVKKSTGGRPSQDYRLTRFACYMIALSADGTKEQVAAAKVYFAVQTRRQELADSEDANYLEWRRRAIASYEARGYSHHWAETRVDGITIRNKLTHEWSVRGIKDKEFAILTDNLHMESFGLTVQQHMGVKKFPVTYKGKRAVYKGDLREALTDVETVVTSLGETVARVLHIEHDSQGFAAINQDIAAAGAIAADTRRQIEAATGKPVVSPRNMINEPDGGLWALLPTEDDFLPQLPATKDEEEK